MCVAIAETFPLPFMDSPVPRLELTVCASVQLYFLLLLVPTGPVRDPFLRLLLVGTLRLMIASSALLRISKLLQLLDLPRQIELSLL